MLVNDLSIFSLLDAKYNSRTSSSPVVSRKSSYCMFCYRIEETVFCYLYFMLCQQKLFRLVWWKISG